MASKWVQAWAILVLAAVAAAQDGPTFRSDAKYVEVSAQVLADGKPLLGLTPQDFKILDEGHAQPISRVSFDEQELDIILLLDLSGSTYPLRETIALGAAQALHQLKFRDRVGIVVFNKVPYLVAAPTWDRMDVLRKLTSLPAPEDTTELNAVLLYTAGYLEQQSRPGVGRAIVMLTDNCGRRDVPDATVRHQLWKTNVTLTALLFPLSGRCPHEYGADVRRFASETGGETVYVKGQQLRLAEVLQSLRQRYAILYRLPDAQPGSSRKIRVDLSDEAKAKHRKITIRARSAYVP